LAKSRTYRVSTKEDSSDTKKIARKITLNYATSAIFKPKNLPSAPHYTRSLAPMNRGLIVIEQVRVWGAGNCSSPQTGVQLARQKKLWKTYPKVRESRVWIALGRDTLPSNFSFKTLGVL